MHANPSLFRRGLSPHEAILLEWLLRNGGPHSLHYVDQIPRLSVFRRCGCGCASLDFAVDAHEWKLGSPMDVVSDFIYKTPGGALCGVFAFAVAGKLAGLEVWSIDGNDTPSGLPSVDALVQFSEFPSAH